MAGPWEKFAEPAGSDSAPWEKYEDTGERALTKGVKESTPESRKAYASADPRRTDTERTRRIAEMDSETDPFNPDYLPITDNAVRALQTDAKGGMDAKRSRYQGRVLDESLPPATPGSMARDALAGGLQIGPTVVKGVGDITRLATGDLAGKSISEFADRGNKAIQEVVGSERSNQQRRRFEQDRADPEMNAADLVVGNPGAMADQVLPTIGSMALPIAAAGAAGKLATASRASKLAAAIDAETVLARANAAREAAVVGTTVAMNAGDTFSTVRDAGNSLSEAYGAAAVTAPFTYVAGKLTGGGAEGQVAKSFAGKAAEAGAKATVKAVGRETGQEMGEQVGQTLGETYGKGEPIDLNKASKDVAVSGVLGGIVGGGAQIATDGAQGIRDAAMARQAKIKTMRDAGEASVADMLQKRHDQISSDEELAQMPSTPEFQEAYRKARADGLKPAEAAGRSAINVTFSDLAAQTGMSEKATAAAQAQADKLPIDQIPAFIAKYTNALAARGLAEPIDGMDQLGVILETARDEAIDAAVGAAYSENDVRKAMDDVLALEQKNLPESQQEPDKPDTKPVAETEGQDDSRSNDVSRAATGSDRSGDSDARVSLEAGLGIPDQGRQSAIEPGSAGDGPAAGPVSLPANNEGALNEGVLRDTNPQAGAAAQAETPSSQAAEAGAVDQARPAATGNQTGNASSQANGVAQNQSPDNSPTNSRNSEISESAQNQPAAQSKRAPAAIEDVAPDFSKDLIDARAGLAGLETERKAARGSKRADLDGQIERIKSMIKELEAYESSSPAAIESASPESKSASNAVEDAAPVRLGRNNVPMSEGGKPFKNKQAATVAKKLQPMMRVVRVEGGFALAEKTEAQLAVEARNAKRLRSGGASPAGEAIPAHAFIADMGGLAPDERANMAMEGNTRVGSRFLFAGAGRGVTIEQALEKLVEDRYLPKDASQDDARDLIKRSLRNPQYTPEGTEMMADREAQAQFDAQAAEQDAIAEIEALSDNQKNALDDSDIPDFDTPGTMSEADAMRAMGFTEEEIDAATNRPDQPPAVSPSNSGVAESAARPAPGNPDAGNQAAREDPPSRSDQEVKAPAARPAVLIELRKRESVLKALRACLES